MRSTVFVRYCHNIHQSRIVITMRDFAIYVTLYARVLHGSSFLYYNEKCIGYVRPNNPSGGVDNNKDLDGIGIWEEISDDNECISFNGIHIGSTRAEAEHLLGKPTVEFDTTNVFFVGFFRSRI